MDVRAGQTSRVRPGKLFAVGNASRNIGSRGFTQENLAATELTENIDALLKGFGMLFDHNFRISRQWVRINSRHKNRGRTRTQSRHFTERASTQRRPETRFIQLRLNLVSTET